MNGVRRWSLRTHLLGMAGAVLVLATAVGLAVTADAYSQAKRRAVTAARDAAGQVAAAIDRDLGQAAMLTAASAPGIRQILEQQAAVTANPDVCSLSFTGIGVFPSDGAVHVLTGDGRVLCSSVRSAAGRSYAGAPWFPRLAGGAPVTAGDGQDVVLHAPVVVVAAPIQSPDGRVGGALVQMLAVGQLAPALAQTFGGPVRRQFTLVDGDGLVLSSSIDPTGQVFPRISDGATALDSQGTKRIWGLGRVQAPSWQLWAGTSEDLALQTARAERRRLGLVLVTTLAAALGLALLVNRRLVRPLRGVSATVAQAETEPGARATIAGPAELADLARSLNHMLAARQHNEELITELARELEATAVSLVEAREHERRSLAIALHDTTLQGLIAAMWQVDGLVERGDSDGSPSLERLRDDLEALIVQTRAVTTSLRPPALEESGLGAAVDELAHRTATESGLDVQVDDRLGGTRFVSAMETLMYRMVQEALQNARKHAQATSVRVMLERDDRFVRATVTYDGSGIDDVVSMRDTVRLAKGRFSITPGDPGTIVTVEVPVGAD